MPRIYYVNGCAGVLDLLRASEADVLGIDWRIELATARGRIGDGVALQGNLDPTVLLAPPATIRERVHAMLEQVPTGRSHLVNLGHGVLRQTPPDHVAAFVEAARSFPVTV